MDRASLQHKETIMKLTTRFELASKSTNELRALYRDIFNALSFCEQPQERRNALASLENICAELEDRAPGF
jgi:hypothetical protein